VTSPFGGPAASGPFGAPASTSPGAAPAPALPANLASLFGAPKQPPRKGVGPKIRDLYTYDAASGQFRGALILYRVSAYETGLPGVEAGKTQNRATVDIAVLDGGPYPWGGDPAKGIPHTEMWDVNNPPEPGWIKGAYVSNIALAAVFEVVYLDQRAGRGTGIGLGRLGRDKATKKGQSDTFTITTNVYDKDNNLVRPAFTDEESALATAWLAKYPAFAAGVTA
jgi:hypothetical protein